MTLYASPLLVFFASAGAAFTSEGGGSALSVWADAKAAAPVNMARIRSVRMTILCGMHSIPTDALAGRERGHWPLTTGDACLIRRSAGPETSAATGTWGMRGLS